MPPGRSPIIKVEEGRWEAAEASGGWESAKLPLFSGSQADCRTRQPGLSRVRHSQGAKGRVSPYAGLP